MRLLYHGSQTYNIVYYYGPGHEIRSNNVHGKIETKIVQYPHCKNLPIGCLCKSSVQHPTIFQFYRTGEMS
jgi:hypothetical protein